MSAFCAQPTEPEFFFGECPAISVGGRHSEHYSEDGEWVCNWCGARPFWPVWPCSLSHEFDFRIYPLHWPNLCRGANEIEESVA